MQGTNRFLEALSEESRSLILSRSTTVELRTRTYIHAAEETPDFLYILTSGVASVVASMEEGGAAEVGMVGTEGVLGVFHLLGSAKPPTSCMIQSNATGYRISLSDFQELFDQRSDIRVRVLEFVQEQAFTANQVAGCHRLHEAEERLSRWLLMAADRASSNTLYLTHEFLAEMLGSRRSTVTIAAGLLQRVGIIEYSRGRVEIVSRERLEESACCCYRTVRKLYDNLYSSALPDERRVSR